MTKTFQSEFQNWITCSSHIISLALLKLMTGNHSITWFYLASLNQWQYQNTNLPGKSTAFRDVFVATETKCPLMQGLTCLPLPSRPPSDVNDGLRGVGTYPGYPTTLRWFHRKDVLAVTQNKWMLTWFAEDIASTYKCCLSPCTRRPGVIFWNSKGYAATWPNLLGSAIQPSRWSFNWPPFVEEISASRLWKKKRFLGTWVSVVWVGIPLSNHPFSGLSPSGNWRFGLKPRT